MAVLTDDDPEDERRRGSLIIAAGLGLGAITSLGAYLFTYEGMGPGFDDPRGRAAVTGLILLGIILTIALLIAGVAGLWFEKGVRTRRQ